MQNADLLMASALLVPAVAGILCLLLKVPAAQKVVVVILTVFLILATTLIVQKGPFSYSPPPLGPLPWDQLLLVGDAALILSFFYFGWRAKNNLILGLTAAQTIAVGFLEYRLSQAHPAGEAIFVLDHLSLVMAVVIGVVGSAIALYALHYMDTHEHHLHLQASRQGRFFAVILVFLGAMNGLVFADSLPWLFFFWEVTTLCSFLLIGHDDTEVARQNAQRALWMNLVGGVAFACGMIVLLDQAHTLSIQKILATSKPSAALLAAMGLVVIGGFTKAAQMPFQSWLLGAMVAPTPVSALLHSSTMVKAGVYLVVRMAPAYEGTWLSQAVAVAGGFTFVATAALAVSQSNAKRVLAYSTISNLGLIMACAGINNALAISAAILLILFHAVSKGLLFLAVGAIEQRIGSRDIEDMEGLLGRMPVTTVVTLVGILSMLLPPFGVLIAKWAAIEAAARAPLVMVMIAAGSAFTVVFWTKWMGRLVSLPPSTQPLPRETMSPFFSIPLVGLAAGAVVLTALVGPVMDLLIEPAVALTYASKGLEAAGGLVASNIGTFPVWPLLIVLAVLLLVAYVASTGREQRVQPAYLCGENVPDLEAAEFRGAADQPQALAMRSYYFEDWLGETRLTKLANPIALVLLVAILGVAFL